MRSKAIFIDANVLIDFFVGEDDLREDAKNLRRQSPDWVTLPWCRYEFGNVTTSPSRSVNAELKRYCRPGEAKA